MPLKCVLRAVRMLPECRLSAARMPFECRSSAARMPFKCVPDAARMPFKCVSDAVRMPLECRLDAVWMPFGLRTSCALVAHELRAHAQASNRQLNIVHRQDEMRHSARKLRHLTANCVTCRILISRQLIIVHTQLHAGANCVNPCVLIGIPPGIFSFSLRGLRTQEHAEVSNF